MNTKVVKQWLARGYQLKKHREELERARRETYDKLTSITAQMGGEAVSGTKDPHRYDELVALNAELDAQINDIARAEREIMQAIDSVDKIQYRRVLFLRYIENRTWDNIAMCMSYHKRTVYRIHGAALASAEPFILKKLSLNVTPPL
jgi:DNA-directed RNA polymerase specialized sigma subunit